MVWIKGLKIPCPKCGEDTRVINTYFCSIRKGIIRQRVCYNKPQCKFKAVTLELELKAREAYDVYDRSNAAKELKEAVI